MSGTQIAAAILSGLYGLATLGAGVASFSSKQTGTSRTVGLQSGASGLLLIAAAAALATDRGAGAFLLTIVALLNAHIMALSNAVTLHKKITPSHHLVRLIVSIVIGILAYSAL